METEVKKSEVMLNKELKERIETLELQLQTVLKINEEFCNKVAKLRRINKELIDQC
jgi:chaperonin cofactor prefoldin